MTKLYPLLLVLASCGTQIKYLGSSHPATQEVDVFVTQSSIKKSFEIIGKGYVEKHVGLPVSVETIQRKAVEKAKQKGANAVVIEDYFMLDKTSSISTKIDSSRNLTQTANINPAISSGFSISFIRYKE